MAVKFSDTVLGSKNSLNDNEPKGPSKFLIILTVLSITFAIICFFYGNKIGGAILKHKLVNSQHWYAYNESFEDEYNIDGLTVQNIAEVYFYSDNNKGEIKEYVSYFLSYYSSEESVAVENGQFVLKRGETIAVVKGTKSFYYDAESINSVAIYIDGREGKLERDAFEDYFVDDFGILSEEFWLYSRWD